MGVARKVAAVACLLAARVASADDPDLQLQLEAGSELDTNVHRTTDSDTQAPVMAGGGRAGARLSLGWRPAPRRAFRLDALGAVKGYATPAEAVDEDVAVVSADARF